VEPPDKRNITDGVQLLEELGAIGVGTGAGASSSTSGRRGGHTLTQVGRRLARLPIDPRLGRMILEAERLRVLRDVLVIAAALSLQDPRERPVEQRPQADQLHARFTDKTSDFLTWLNLWRYLREQQRELSGSAFRRMCKREHLNYLRVREWQDFESQLRQVCREMGLDAPLVPRGGSTTESPQRTTRTPSTRPCCPACSATSGCWRSATGRCRGRTARAAPGNTSVLATAASRSSRAAG
jgi:ATP-dependent helicase HrpA